MGSEGKHNPTRDLVYTIEKVHNNDTAGKEEENGITVLLTGFGPFRDHVVNASWQAVRLIPDRGIALPSNIPSGTHVKIVACEVPVIYDTVAEVVPKLWEQHKPNLVVHVGVSGIARAVTMEQVAHNCGYASTDILDCIPEDSVCKKGGMDILQSDFNMQKVVAKVNAYGRGLKAECSFDPGRYLCDFTYYQSLNIDNSRAAFIHVPPLGKPWDACELADAIGLCLTELLCQLQETNALRSIRRPVGNFVEDTLALEANRL